MLKNMKLRTKLLTIGCILTIIPLMVVSTIVFFQNQAILKTAKNQTMDSSNKELNQIVDLVYTMLESHQEANQKYLRNSLNVARQILTQKGIISFSGEKATWNAVNQFTNAAATLEIPKMLAGDAWLGQINDPKTEVVIVDQVRNLMDTTCTIFQRMNEAGDMLRVATNVLKTDGTRAIGTFIPAVNPDTKSNPVVSAVLNGQTYIGRAYVVNNWYNAAYEPIYDAEKKVIGMLYVGIPQENVKGLRKAIMSIKIGKTGYVYVLDSKGVISILVR